MVSGLMSSANASLAYRTSGSDDAIELYGLVSGYGMLVAGGLDDMPRTQG